MAAIEVRNGYKYYGSKSKPDIVLNNLNMTVQPGSIYGLLGASGCGKTTLLSCIVGQRQLNSGEVRVLGQKPGVPGSGIPGSRIGYMPQEMALCEQLSVKESVYYFGHIYCMTYERIREKYKSLKQLLQLPPSSELIDNCSGGQQRRVSFACALIHDPELLILDEPTVGLDPVLREKIWDFLVATTRNSNTAVIITTHYIEEAKQANCIGLMRNGILLAEDTPENVMLRFEVNSIEDAFLILSQRQGSNDSILQNTTQLPSQRQHQMQVVYNGHQVIDSSQQTTIHSAGITNGTRNNINNPKSSLSLKRGPIKALLAKDFIKMSRNPMMVCFMFLLPIISMVSFYLAVGKTIKGTPLGIVNRESTCENLNMTKAFTLNDTCYLNNISCHFIKRISSTDFLKPVLYQDAKDAYRDAKKSYIIGYIDIPENFSRAMQARLEDGRDTDDYTLEQTILTTRLDMGAGQSTYYTELKLREHYQNFIEDILADCDFPTKLASVPVVFKEPIYGTEDADYQQFMEPGVVLMMAFFINTLVTATIFIDERSDGVWDRTLIAGVSCNLLLWSHLFTQFIITIIQTAEVILMIALAFSRDYQGSTVSLVALVFLVSVCGMFYGLFLSIYCKTHAATSYTSTGTFYIMIVMCGLIWPLEAMPEYLKQFVLITPFTLPTVSARSIIERGWGITTSEVYNGYLIVTAWIIIFYILCVIGLKRKM